MASGHVNRIKRPNTWLHRPILQNVKKALANSEPSTHGHFSRYDRVHGGASSGSGCLSMVMQVDRIPIRVDFRC